MPSRRVTRTELAGRTPYHWGGGDVHSEHARAIALVANLAGADAGKLFSVPTPASGEVIDWATSLEGPVHALNELVGEERREATRRLRILLARLQSLLDDDEIGGWLRRALIVPGPGAVHVVGGQPVLVDWGLSRAGEDARGELQRLMQAGLGPFLESARATEVRTEAGLEGGTARAVPTAALTTVATSSGWERMMLPAGIAVAALFLLFGFWLGSHLVRQVVTDRSPIAALIEDPSEFDRALDLQKQQNEALERRIAELRGALEVNVCVADPAAMPRLGPDRAAPVPPASLPPPPQGRPSFSGDLAALLDQGVVLVIVRGGPSLGTGSGFFVTPDLVVTNRHVVASGGAVTIANRKIGAVPAEVVAMTPTGGVLQPDFALLRVPSQEVQPLGLTREAARLDEVIAAGFPAMVAGVDQTYRAILGGDNSAATRLEVILSDGRIQAIQESPSGLKALPHSAQISPGSSGGPLVDQCGRVKGVNTFGSSSEKMPVTVSYAHKTDNLLAFLAEQNVAQAEAGPCVAQPSPPATPPTPSQAR